MPPAGEHLGRPGACESRSETVHLLVMGEMDSRRALSYEG